MSSASQQIRRTAEAVSCSPVSVVANPDRSRSSSQVHGQGEPGDGAVGLGEQVGGLQESAGCEEGVEHPGAVVAWVAAVGAAGIHAGVGVADWLGGLGCGQWDESDLEQGGVLGRAASFDPGTTGLVLGDREIPTQVRDAFEAVEGFLVSACVAVGVDEVD